MHGRTQSHFLAEPPRPRCGEGQDPSHGGDSEDELDERDTVLRKKRPGAPRAPGGRRNHRPLPTGTAFAGFSFGSAGGEERREAEEDDERILAVRVVGPLTVT